MANLYRKPDAMRTIERAGAAIVARCALNRRDEKRLG
jgi:hypothetical protein